MKNVLRFSAVVLLTLIAQSVKSQSNQEKIIIDAVEYNDYIVQQQISIGNELQVLMSVINDIVSEKAEALTQLDMVDESVSNAINNLKNLKTLDKDFGMKQGAIDLFSFYKKIIKSSYASMINEIYSDEPDNDKLDQLSKEITEDEAKYDAEFLGAQKKFAEYYNITLN